MAKYEEGALVTLINTASSSTLTDGSLIGVAYDNTGASDLWFWANFQLKLKFTGGIPTAGDAVAELYLCPKVSNYPEGYDGTNTPQAALLVGVFETRAPSTTVTEHLVLPAILLTPAEMYIVIKNISGESFDPANGGSGWGCSMIPFRTQK